MEGSGTPADFLAELRRQNAEVGSAEPQGYPVPAASASPSPMSAPVTAPGGVSGGGWSGGQAAVPAPAPLGSFAVDFEAILKTAGVGPTQAPPQLVPATTHTPAACEVDRDSPAGEAAWPERRQVSAIIGLPQDTDSNLGRPSSLPSWLTDIDSGGAGGALAPAPSAAAAELKAAAPLPTRESAKPRARETPSAKLPNLPSVTNKAVGGAKGAGSGGAAGAAAKSAPSKGGSNAWGRSNSMTWTNSANLRTAMRLGTRRPPRSEDLKPLMPSNSGGLVRRQLHQGSSDKDDGDDFIVHFDDEEESPFKQQHPHRPAAEATTASSVAARSAKGGGTGLAKVGGAGGMGGGSAAEKAAADASVLDMRKKLAEQEREMQALRRLRAVAPVPGGSDAVVAGKGGRLVVEAPKPTKSTSNAAAAQAAKRVSMVARGSAGHKAVVGGTAAASPIKATRIDPSVAKSTPTVPVVLKGRGTVGAATAVSAVKAPVAQPSGGTRSVGSGAGAATTGKRLAGKAQSAFPPPIKPFVDPKPFEHFSGVSPVAVVATKAVLTSPSDAMSPLALSAAALRGKAAAVATATITAAALAAPQPPPKFSTAPLPAEPTPPSHLPPSAPAATAPPLPADLDAAAQAEAFLREIDICGVPAAESFAGAPQRSSKAKPPPPTPKAGKSPNPSKDSSKEPRPPAAKGKSGAGVTRTPQPAPSLMVAAAVPAAHPVTGKRSSFQFACKHFNDGKCNWGSKCQYQHICNKCGSTSHSALHNKCGAAAAPPSRLPVAVMVGAKRPRDEVTLPNDVDMAHLPAPAAEEWATFEREAKRLAIRGSILRRQQAELDMALTTLHEKQQAWLAALSPTTLTKLAFAPSITSDTATSPTAATTAKPAADAAATRTATTPTPTLAHTPQPSGSEAVDDAGSELEEGEHPPEQKQTEEELAKSLAAQRRRQEAWKQRATGAASGSSTATSPAASPAKASAEAATAKVSAKPLAEPSAPEPVQRKVLYRRSDSTTPSKDTNTPAKRHHDHRVEEVKRPRCAAADHDMGPTRPDSRLPTPEKMQLPGTDSAPSSSGHHSKDKEKDKDHKDKSEKRSKDKSKDKEEADRKQREKERKDKEKKANEKKEKEKKEKEKKEKEKEREKEKEKERKKNEGNKVKDKGDRSKGEPDRRPERSWREQAGLPLPEGTAVTANANGSESSKALYDKRARFDPHRPLCPFHMRGRCNDAACPYQHPAVAGRTTGPQRTSPGAAALKEPHTVPAYVRLAPPPPAAVRGGRPPLLAAPALVYRGVPAAAVRILALSGSRALAELAALAPHGVHGETPAHAGTEAEGAGSSSVHSGRYFASAGVASAEAALQAAVEADPQDVDSWVGLIAAHANPARVSEVAGAAPATPGPTTPADRACCVLARALEANPQSAVLWVLYLHLIQQLFPSRLSELGAHAVKTQPRSYALWDWLIHAHPQPELCVQVCEKAVAGMLLVAPEQAPGAEAAFLTARSAAVLNLLLMELGALCVDVANESLPRAAPARRSAAELRLSLWLKALAAADIGPTSISAATPADGNAGRLRAVLTALVAGDRSVLWACATHVAAFGELPQVAATRLGYAHVPFVLDWEQIRADCINTVGKAWAPPEGGVAPARRQLCQALLAAALGHGVGGLYVLPPTAAAPAASTVLGVRAALDKASDVRRCLVHTYIATKAHPTHGEDLVANGHECYKLCADTLRLRPGDDARWALGALARLLQLAELSAAKGHMDAALLARGQRALTSGMLCAPLPDGASMAAPRSVRLQAHRTFVIARLQAGRSGAPRARALLAQAVSVAHHGDKDTPDIAPTATGATRPKRMSRFDQCAPGSEPYDPYATATDPLSHQTLPPSTTIPPPAQLPPSMLPTTSPAADAALPQIGMDGKRSLGGDALLWDPFGPGVPVLTWRCRAAINSTDPIAQLPPCPTDATASELLSRLWIEALRDPYPPESAAAGSSGASHSADAHAPHDFTTLEKYAWRALEAQSGAEGLQAGQGSWGDEMQRVWMECLQAVVYMRSWHLHHMPTAHALAALLRRLFWRYAGWSVCRLEAVSDLSLQLRTPALLTLVEAPPRWDHASLNAGAFLVMEAEFVERVLALAPGNFALGLHVARRHSTAHVRTLGAPGAATAASAGAREAAGAAREWALGNLLDSLDAAGAAAPITAYEAALKLCEPGLQGDLPLRALHDAVLAAARAAHPAAAPRWDAVPKYPA